MPRDEDPAPRIGRGRISPRFPTGEVMRIVMLVVALVFVLMMRQGCADGVARFFGAFAPPPGATADGG